MNNAKIYSISYNIKTHERHYEDFFTEIKKTAWAHALETHWLIKTHETAEQIYTRLIRHIDENDVILINQFGRDYEGIFSDYIREWIEDKNSHNKL